MRKILICFAAALLVITGNVYASSIGGVPMVKQGEVALGTDLSFGFGQDFKYISADGLSSTEDYRDTEKDNEYNISVKVSYGVLDFLNIYAKIGIIDYDISTDYYNAGVKQSSLETDLDTGISYGIGLSGSYDLDNDWLVGGDLQYFYADEGCTATNTPVSGAVQIVEYGSQKVSGWHIASYLGKKIDKFTPYAGVRYSDADLKIKDPNVTGVADNLKYEADDNFGIFFGTDYAIDTDWKINFEVRLIDEQAVSCGVNYKF